MYLNDWRIDWGWPERSEEERAIVRRHQIRLDEGPHTLDSFLSELASASSEMKAVEIRALVTDEDESSWLLLARSGEVTSVPVETRPWWKPPWLRPSTGHERTIR